MAALDRRPRSLACVARHAPCVLDQLALRAHAGVFASGGSVMSSHAVSDSWVERAEATLAAAGHKRGGARRAVLDLLDGQRCALTAVEIEDALRGESRRVSRASVYRILDELERLRLVQRVETGQAMVRYERVCGHEEHHHHLVCDEC